LAPNRVLLCRPIQKGRRQLKFPINRAMSYSIGKLHGGSGTGVDNRGNKLRNPCFQPSMKQVRMVLDLQLINMIIWHQICFIIDMACLKTDVGSLLKVNTRQSDGVWIKGLWHAGFDGGPLDIMSSVLLNLDRESFSIRSRPGLALALKQASGH